MKLSQLRNNQMAVIISTDNLAVNLVQKLLTIGLEPNIPFQVKHKAPFNGPLCISSRGKLIMLRHKEAQNINVALHQN